MDFVVSPSALLPVAGSANALIFGTALGVRAGMRRARLGDEARFRFDAPSGYALGSALRAHRAATDFVIIDTAPVADFTVKRAVREADLVLVPLQLTPLDLEATLPTAALVGAEGRTARFFINRTPPRARVADLIRREIKTHALPMLGVEFGARAAFAESIAKGAGVVETAPSSPAADEARRLARAIMVCAGRAIAAA